MFHVEHKRRRDDDHHHGDTAQSGRKPATLETGLVIKVPMHVETGQVVRVDTRTGEYVETVG